MIQLALTIVWFNSNSVYLVLQGELIESNPRIVYSKTFNNKRLTQGSEPASRDISPNNNNNGSGGGGGNHHMHSKQTVTTSSKQPRNNSFPRRFPTHKTTTPTASHQSKRKRPAAGKFPHQLKDID